MEGCAEPGPTDDTTPPSDVAAAVADLASLLGIEGHAVELVAEEDVTWRDGSLGCGQPGRFSTQALVPGKRILLRANGMDYEYHAGAGRPPFHCPDPTQ